MRARSMRSERGALLVSLVIAMTVVGLLGGAVVGLTTSSAYERLIANDSIRAYYLAEAGGDYAKRLIRADPDARPSGSFTLAANSGVFVLSSFDDPLDAARTIVQSTGIHHRGRRLISFNVPKQSGAGGGTWEGSGDIDDDNSSNPDPDDQSYSVVDLDGDPALRIDSARFEADYFWSPYIYETLRYIDAGEFLTEAWEQSGNFLSYDVQVKMRVDHFGTDESHMIGISFRVADDESGYGLSFAKASDYQYVQGTGDAYDGIPGEYIPDEFGPYRYWLLFWWANIVGDHDISDPVILLWEDLGQASNLKSWMAYSRAATHNILDLQAPKEWCTLLLRIKEAPSFTCADITSIAEGDTITQGASVAVVDSEPLFDGAGVGGALILSGVEGTFVPGAATVNATGSVSITEFRESDNFIRTFIADKDGTVADANPYNDTRQAFPRGTWNEWPANPVSDWTVADDYFTLITWEFVNPSPVTPVTALGPAGRPNTVIRTQALTTPASGSLNGPELALHTFGWLTADDAYVARPAHRPEYTKDYYFDDFALRVDPWGSVEPAYQY